MTSDIERMRGEIARRRTFAIISHPDAGKTTLTEKLLLYGGSIHLAGEVKQRSAGSRKTTSDWMELERQRGISVSTSVLQFEFQGCRVNLLDTPGHNDFSEDTYRTLSAVDAAVMLIDNAKGVEAQTIKLFQVCRMRGIPIITIINKMDRAGRDPLELLDEIERVLGIPTSPANWPIGSGQNLQGLCDRWSGRFLRFETVDHGAKRALMSSMSLDDPAVDTILSETVRGQLRDELALLEEAGSPFSPERFAEGKMTPVFFASAITNFGLEPFLERFIDLSPPPRARQTEAGPIETQSPFFSAFIFKIQANMDPQHRDRVAFARVCSGRFERGMETIHARTGKRITLSRTLHFLGQDRQLVDEAYAGDIIGIWDPGILRIGDTLSDQGGFAFDGIPRFSPEHFVRVRLEDPMKRKQLKKGLEQLSEEGAVQLFFDRTRLERDPVLGAVGVLQFEVTQYRLENEYGAQVSFQRLPFRYARWIEAEPGAAFDAGRFEDPGRSTCLVDVEGRPLVLFQTEWALRTAETDHPKLRFIAAMQPGRSARSAA